MYEKSLTASLFLLGSLLTAYSVYSAIYLADPYWYSYFTIGGTLTAASINRLLNQSTLLFDLNTRPMKVWYEYLWFLGSAIVIELVGRFLLHLWIYPFYGLPAQSFNVFLIGYPFGLFLAFEVFALLKYFLGNWNVTIFAATLVSAYINEAPNLYANEWVYTPPTQVILVLGINMVVWIGWVILIIIPLQVRKILALELP